MSSKFRWRAFTLVELMTVIGIIAILVGIIVPTTLTARTSARRAQARVQFSQWAAAMELFRTEYGFYPTITDTQGKLNSSKFSATLTGRALDGSEISDEQQLGGNVRRLSFYALHESDFDASASAIADVFGNTDIAVLVDTNGDVRITTTDGPTPRVRSVSTGIEFVPDATQLDLVRGVRAGVIFYSAGNGRGPEDLIVGGKP